MDNLLKSHTHGSSLLGILIWKAPWLFMTERTVQSSHDIKHCGEKTAVSHECLPWESSHVFKIAFDIFDERTFIASQRAFFLHMPCSLNVWLDMCVFLLWHAMAIVPGNMSSKESASGILMLSCFCSNLI